MLLLVSIPTMKLSEVRRRSASGLKADLVPYLNKSASSWIALGNRILFSK